MIDKATCLAKYGHLKDERFAPWPGPLDLYIRPDLQSREETAAWVAAGERFALRTTAQELRQFKADVEGLSFAEEGEQPWTFAYGVAVALQFGPNQHDPFLTSAGLGVVGAAGKLLRKEKAA